MSDYEWAMKKVVEKVGNKVTRKGWRNGEFASEIFLTYSDLFTPGHPKLYIDLTGKYVKRHTPPRQFGKYYPTKKDKEACDWYELIWDDE